jgi:hypothetical protein
VYNHQINDDGVKHCSSLVTTEVHIEHVTADPFGQIKAAELKIAGPLLKVNLHKSSGRSGMPRATLHVDDKPLVTREVDLDAWPDEGQEAHLIFICLEEYKELQLVGLVLERVQERRGCYRRLGKFLTTTEGREDGMNWATSDRLPDNEYEEILASGDYRITIV